MSILKDLVDKVRQETQTQGELVEGEGVRRYEFGDANQTNQYPDAGQYSQANTSVGNQPEELETVRVIGEDLLADGTKRILSSFEADDFLGIANPIINKMVFDSDFLFDQTKLHTMNRLSGKVFNPIGVLASMTSDSGDTVTQALRQALSDVVDGGAFHTTDGKTFDRVFDNDAQSKLFTAEQFRTATQGGSGLVGSFVNNAISSLAQSVGVNVPTRSILAQVVAYNASLVEDTGPDQQRWFHDQDSEEYGGGSSDLKINPIGSGALNYLYDPMLIAEDPIKFFELRRRVRNGLFAQNILNPKDDDIIKAEKRNLVGDKKVKNQISNFINDRIFDGLVPPDKYYKNSGVEYRPEDMEEGELLAKLLSHYFKPYITRGELTRDEATGFYLDYLLAELKDQFYSNRGSNAINTVFQTEEDRVDRLKAYRGREYASDTEKLNSLKNANGFVDTDDPSQSEGYHNHNIVVKLGDTLRSKIKNKTFSEYKRILDENNLSVDDRVLMADIQPTPDRIGNELGTMYFMAFEDIRTERVCYLRPSFDNLNEDIQINNNDIMYLGRTEPLPNYENTTRTITFPFTLYSRTPREFLMMYKKIAFLKSLAYPIASASDDFKKVQNPLLRFTLGNIFKRIGGYLNTLNFTYSNQDAVWETEGGVMAPKTIECSLSFTVLHDSMPYVSRNNVFNFDRGETDQFVQHDVDYSELNI